MSKMSSIALCISKAFSLSSRSNSFRSSLFCNYLSRCREVHEGSMLMHVISIVLLYVMKICLFQDVEESLEVGGMQLLHVNVPLR